MSNASNVRVAFKKSSTWGTAVSLNESNAELLLSTFPDLKETPEFIDDPVLGTDFLEYSYPGNRNVEPTLEGKFRWAGRHLNMLSLVLGSDSPTDLMPAGGTQYAHVMDAQSVQPAAHYGTLVMYDGLIYREVPSFKPSGFTFSGEAGDFFNLSFQGMGNTVLTTGQTNTTFSNLTASTKQGLIPFGCLRVRINDHSGAALATGDIVKPNSVSLNFTRSLGDGFVTKNVTCNGRDEFIMDEPTQLSFGEVEVTMAFPQYVDQVYLDNFQEGTFKKMDWFVQGEEYDAVNSLAYDFTMSFPNLLITDVTHSANAGERIVESLTMKAMYIAVAPTGMAVNSPVRIRLVNNITTAFNA